MRLPFFRPRLTSQVALARTTGRDTTGAPSPPPAKPRELVDVVGVGITKTAGGVALTLLSLERYREGYVALFRLLRPRGRFEREFPMPSLELTVTPEGTAPYRVWNVGSGGGGGMRELEYRMSYAIVPTPPTNGGETVIEVREISWESHSQGKRKVVSVDTGPWRFTIGL